MKQAGWQQSAIWLPPKAVARLKKLCKAQGLTKQEAITGLILQADARAPEAPPPASKKASARKKPAAKKAAAAKKQLAKTAVKKKSVSKRRKTTVELDTIVSLRQQSVKSVKQAYLRNSECNVLSH